MQNTDLVERSKEDVMLTTFDNPYNPFDDYERWWKFDRDAGYNTPELLARVAVTSDTLSDADYELACEQAMQDLLDNDPYGMYLRVKKSNIEKLLPDLIPALQDV